MAAERSTKVIAGFLAISYGLAGPLVVFLEYRNQLFSQRFDLPPEVIYLTSLIQFLCAFGVLIRPLAPWSALALTATTIGAIASHLRMGNPIGSLVAILYSAAQLWFWFQKRRR